MTRERITRTERNTILKLKRFKNSEVWFKDSAWVVILF